MLVTATPNSVHAFSEGSTPSDQGPSQPRQSPRTYLDVFNPPIDAPLEPSVSPGSSPAALPSTIASSQIRAPPPAPIEVSCSASNYPASFAAQPEKPLGSPSSFGSQSPSLVFRGMPGSPALNIRRAGSSASISSHLEEFHLEDNGGKEGGILHHHHHYYGPHSPLHSKYSPRVGTRRQFSLSELTHEDLHSPRANTRRQFSLSELTHDDIFAPATTEEVKNPELLAKHHDALYSALDSPPKVPGTRRTSIQDLAIPIIPIEETTISSSIPLYEVPQDLMVPLLNRRMDMKGLLSHPSWSRSLVILKNVIGEEAFDGKLMKLWTETDRKDVPDAEWLWRTKSIIMQAAGDGDRTREWKLWGDFCEMVGFDEEDTSIDRDDIRSEKRSGTPAETMERVVEEDEEPESGNGTSKP